MADEAVGPNDLRSSDAGSLGSALSEIEKKYKKVKEDQALRIRELGGPQAYVRKTAPRVFSLFTGQWTERAVMAETEAGWVAADERLAQCASCPPSGGACAESATTAEPGKMVWVEADGTIEFRPCERWDRHLSIGRLRAAGLADNLMDVTFDEIFERVDGYALRDAFRRWLGAVRRRERVPSFLLTGGKYERRTEFLAAVTHHFVENSRLRVHYTFGPRLAVQLREFYEAGSKGDSVLDRCESADVLLFDFVDPKNWKPWFIERIDLMLWTRVGACKPTILSSTLPLEEFKKHFPYAGTYSLEELSIVDPAFGPFRRD